MRILDAGLHICHMLGYDDLQRCLDFVTDNSARALCLGDNYGLAEGRPANLLILDAEKRLRGRPSSGTGADLHSPRQGDFAA